MVINKLSLLRNKTKQLRKAGLAVGGTLLMSGFIACGPSYDTKEVLDPTKGVITEVKEIETDLFRITNETIVDSIKDSRIIAEYLDGMRDTFTLDEARLVESGGSRLSAERHEWHPHGRSIWLYDGQKHVHPHQPQCLRQSGGLPEK